MKVTLESKTWTGLVATRLLVVLLGFAAEVLIKESTAHLHDHGASAGVADRVQAILEQLREVDFVAGEFLVSGDESTREFFGAESAALVERLDEPTTGNPSRESLERQLGTLDRLVRAQLAVRTNQLQRQSATSPFELILGATTDSIRDLIDSIQWVSTWILAEDLHVENAQAIESIAVRGRWLPILFGGGVAACGVIAASLFLIDRDIRRHRRSDSELALSEARLQSIIDNTSACIYVKDLTGRYVLANQALLALVGWARSELLG